MRIRNLELWLALLTIIIITMFYLGTVAIDDIPAASGLVGHSLGIVGFVLMLMTEVLYSLRKRYQFARWGKLEHWLSFHIFTGLVGPYMVLLHSSWKFNGLAGILMLMTVIIVISGFVGRYFYTAVPRAVDGAELEVEQIRELALENQKKLMELKQIQPELYRQFEELFSKNFGSKTKQVSFRRKWRKMAETLGEDDRNLLQNLSLAWDRERIFDRQIAQLATSRRLLALWHTLHIPLGVAMFTIALIHIGATLYYATLLR